MPIRPLDTGEFAFLHRLLAADAAPNLYLLHQLEKRSGSRAGSLDARLFGLQDNSGALSAVLYASPGGLATVWAPETDQAAELGRFLNGRRQLSLLVGPRQTCDTLWQAYGDPAGAKRYQQRLYHCQAPAEGPHIKGLRRARPADRAQLCDFASQMMLEDLGFDPALINREAHERSVGRRVDQGRTWVAGPVGDLHFKVDIGFSTRLGVMLGGTYVPPRTRACGVCTRAMRTLLAELLREHAQVVLHLNEWNEAAISCYQRAGFQRGAAMRLLLVRTLVPYRRPAAQEES